MIKYFDILKVNMQAYLFTSIILMCVDKFALYRQM